MRSKPVSVRGNRREKYLALLRGEGEERMSWARAHMCSNRERLMFRRRCEECSPLGLHELLLLSLQNKSPALPKNLGQKSQGNKPLLTPAHVSKPRTQQHSSLAETCGSKKWEKSSQSCSWFGERCQLLSVVPGNSQPARAALIFPTSSQLGVPVEKVWLLLKSL